MLSAAISKSLWSSREQTIRRIEPRVILNIGYVSNYIVSLSYSVCLGGKRRKIRWKKSADKNQRNRERETKRTKAQFDDGSLRYTNSPH